MTRGRVLNPVTRQTGTSCRSSNGAGHELVDAMNMVVKANEKERSSPRGMT